MDVRGSEPGREHDAVVEHVMPFGVFFRMADGTKALWHLFSDRPQPEPIYAAKPEEFEVGDQVTVTVRKSWQDEHGLHLALQLRARCKGGRETRWQVTKDDIKRFQFARPFKPFTLRLADGRSFEVDHPEFLIHSRRSQSVLFADRDDKWRLIDLRHVLSIDADQPPDDETERDRLGLDDQE